MELEIVEANFVPSLFSKVLDSLSSRSGGSPSAASICYATPPVSRSPVTELAAFPPWSDWCDPKRGPVTKRIVTVCPELLP